MDELESKDKLMIRDSYSASLGLKSKEKHAIPSLKVADLSITVAKTLKESTANPDFLRIVDDESSLARFNDEKSWVEFVLTRVFARGALTKSPSIRGLITGVHSEWVYKRLEAAADGIIDFKLEESGEETKNMIRIRTMRNVSFDSRWHQLKVGENFEVMLEK